MHFGSVNDKFASLAIHPKIDVVKFVRFADNMEIGTGEIDRAANLTNGIVNLDKLQGKILASLVIQNVKQAVAIELTINVLLHRRLDIIDVKFVRRDVRRYCRVFR